MPNIFFKKSNTSGFNSHFKAWKDAVQCVSFCIIYRPIFSIFFCGLIGITYLSLFSEKAQQVLASFPYEKYLSKFKSRKMITIYATLLEVVLELFMTIVLAGVSIIITLWLMIEEMTEIKKKPLNEKKSFTYVIMNPPRSKSKAR